jgi:hypothetical protein
MLKAEIRKKSEGRRSLDSRKKAPAAKKVCFALQGLLLSEEDLV